ncbi:MAG: thioredoxin [Lachnospiraceae bacterium]
MSIIIGTKENFESEVLASTKPVLVDFYADWCGPCKMVAPILHEIAEERSDILVCKVNVDDAPELASKYQVVNIPTIVCIKNKEVANKTVGAVSKDAILNMI